MSFSDCNEVHFQLRGATLSVRLEDGLWRMKWKGKTAHHRHPDEALARLLGEPSVSVMPLVAQVLRARPGSTIE